MQPKYLNRTAAGKTSILFESLPSKYLMSDSVVVTEAILSAIRVGWYYKAYSTLGSDLTDANASRLSDRRVLLWYDPDKAGAEGSVRACKKLRSIGCNAINVRTEKKPKQYTNQQIQEILWKAENERE
jgi:hypothetical protein